MDVEGAPRAEGVLAQQLDVAKRHGAPLMLAIAGGQAAARAYMAVRSSLPKVQYKQHVPCMSLVPTPEIDCALKSPDGNQHGQFCRASASSKKALWKASLQP